MKSNIVIKILAVLLVLVLGFVIFLGKEETSNASTQSQPEVESMLHAIETGPTAEDNGLDIDPLKETFIEDEYGVDVDSPVETMRTLTNQTRAVRQENMEIMEENRQLKQEVSKLLKMESNLRSRIESRFNTSQKNAEHHQRELEHTQGMTKNLIKKLEDRLAQLQKGDDEKKGHATAHGYDINSAGIPSGLGYDENGMEVNFDELVWINPVDLEINKNDPSKISLPEFTKDMTDDLPELTSNPAKRNKKKDKEERSIKAYTIPVNATLMGSVGMTALLGRIPVGGQVVDSYPFKVIIGPENLSSNGIEIPGIAGIKMSGRAKGDWTLSCVSGEILSMTFTFKDGTIVTHPEPGTQLTEPLAWFSDRYGIPCVTGQRITNAVSYLSSRILLSSAAAYANAEAASEFTTTSNSDGSFTSGLTGDAKTVAKNTAISSGLNEATDWLDERQENSFDAIYVKPGTELVVHITKQLEIDYDPEGRKVNHYANIIPGANRYLD